MKANKARQNTLEALSIVPESVYRKIEYASSSGKFFVEIGIYHSNLANLLRAEGFVVVECPGSHLRSPCLSVSWK